MSSPTSSSLRIRCRVPNCPFWLCFPSRHQASFRRVLGWPRSCPAICWQEWTEAQKEERAEMVVHGRATKRTTPQRQLQVPISHPTPLLCCHLSLASPFFPPDLASTLDSDFLSFLSAFSLRDSRASLILTYHLWPPSSSGSFTPVPQSPAVSLATDTRPFPPVPFSLAYQREKAQIAVASLR